MAAGKARHRGDAPDGFARSRLTLIGTRHQTTIPAAGHRIIVSAR